MKLLFAQGNPGRQYARTRHNVGWMMLDDFAEANGASWKTSDKFNAELAEAHIDGEKVLLVKPQSFYNETGLVARALVDFYKLDPSEDVLVIHDELALPYGTLRTRQKGSDAGNNGIKSLNSHLGQDYARLRIGVWNEQRDQMDDANFVLSAFTLEEQPALKDLFTAKIKNILTDFIQGNLEITSHS